VDSFVLQSISGVGYEPRRECGLLALVSTGVDGNFVHYKQRPHAQLTQKICRGIVEALSDTSEGKETNIYVVPQQGGGESVCTCGSYMCL
jgi:hypothetical protein